MHKFTNSIQIKVFSGFLILAITIIGLVYFILFNSEQSQILIDEKSQFHSLTNALGSIQKSNDIYISNAARDYESYYRDLEVYYKVLIFDISSIDVKIEEISRAKDILTELSQSSFNLIKTTKIEKLNLSIENTQTTWKEFRNELIEQFGDNTEEPRLEWGAKYIAENVGKVATQFDSLINSFDIISSEQSELSKLSGQITVAVLFIFFVLFGIFFYFYVTNPLQIAKLAFQRVSEGDFGHQIQMTRYDEIGQLIYSFNQMSARSNSVLSILSNLQSIETLDQIVGTLFSHSKDYIGCDLVILVKPNLNNNGYTLSNIAPQKGFRNLSKVNIAIDTEQQITYMQELFHNGVSLRINNIPQYINQNANAEILKGLIRRYPLKSVLLQPLNKSENENTLLVLASYNENRFTPQHVELLNHLVPFINHKLKSIENKKQPVEHIQNKAS